MCMWLIILALASTVATAMWYSRAEDDRYMLKFLALMLWGATFMVFVDRIIRYLMDGRAFIELTAEAVALGIILLTVALMLWEMVLLLKDPRGVLYGGERREK